MKHAIPATRAGGVRIKGSLIPKPFMRSGSVHCSHWSSFTAGPPMISSMVRRTIMDASCKSCSNPVVSTPRMKCMSLHASAQNRNKMCCPCGSPRFESTKHVSFRVSTISLRHAALNDDDDGCSTGRPKTFNPWPAAHGTRGTLHRPFELELELSVSIASDWFAGPHSLHFLKLRDMPNSSAP